MTERKYQSGFGNQFATEAVPGALPQGRNSPQRVALGLYAELVSGSAFTAPRAENRRSWLYRRQPSVVTSAYQPYAQPWLKTGAGDGLPMPPDPLRWHPAPIPHAQEQALDFVDGLRFKPSGMSLHNCMVPHGPDTAFGIEGLKAVTRAQVISVKKG